MKPTQVAATLRHIAAKIDASKNPSRELVARDLKHVLAQVDNAPDSGFTVYENPKSIEEHFAWLGPVSAKSQSDLLWHAMKAMNMMDWEPSSDVNSVIAKVQEIGLAAGVPNDTLEVVKQYTMKNYETAKKMGFPLPGTEGTEQSGD
jgi:hypothetical protein